MSYRYAIAAAMLLALIITVSCQNTGDQQMSDEQDRPTTVTEMIVEDIVVGDGAEATAGASAVVHYTGWLYAPGNPDNRGNKFDSSVDRGQPFTFPVGQGRVIRGWDEGVAGMKVGGKRVLIIPPDMGYGARGAGDTIPPNSTLLFEVELLDLN